jgi:hypothetical protein
MISYNRSLCELEFKDKFLNEVEVELLEYVWMKIREKFRNPIETLIINFKDFTKFTDKHRNKNQRLKKSVERLDDTTVITNTKSDRLSEEYNFKFTVFYRETIGGKVPKGFTVNFDEKLYVLFDEPTSYSKYEEKFIYILPTKHSKLLYKFLIGYKFKKDGFYVKSDVLMKILNIDTHQRKRNGDDVDYSYIQSQYIYKSVDLINKNTDLTVSMKKNGNDYDGNGNEIVKYIVKIEKYRGDDKVKGEYLKNNNNKRKTDKEIRIDKWLEDLKIEIDDYDSNSKQIPMVAIKNKITHLPIYIDDEYRLRDFYDVYTNSPTQTLNKLNKWIKTKEFDFEVLMMDGYSKPFEKVCLLSKKQLKERRLI